MNSILISYFKKPSQCHVTMSNKHIHVFQSKQFLLMQKKHCYMLCSFRYFSHRQCDIGNSSTPRFRPGTGYRHDQT